MATQRYTEICIDAKDMGSRLQHKLSRVFMKIVNVSPALARLSGM